MRTQILKPLILLSVITGLLSACSRPADLKNMPGVKNPNTTITPPTPITNEEAKLEWTQKSMIYPSTSVGETKEITMTLTNNGKVLSAPVWLSLSDSQNEFAPKVGFDSCTGKKLSPAETCQVMIRFAPSAIGMRTTTLMGSDSKTADMAYLFAEAKDSILGTPAALEWSISSYDYGSALLGQTKDVLLTLTNTGEVTSLSLATTFINPDAAISIITGQNNCVGKRLSGGMSCTVKVRFAPTVAANASTKLRATDGVVSDDVDFLAAGVSLASVTPAVNPLSFSTNEDVALNASLSAIDPQGLALTYTIGSQPTHGTVVITNAATGAFTYTPSANYNGPDSFTYQAANANYSSSSATVSLTVTPVNDVPVANNSSLSTNEDTSANGSLVAADADLGALTYSIVSQPTHGTVVITNASTGAYTYTPSLNYNGSDSFTFKANDGSVDSNTATVSVTVNSVNDAPEVQNQILTVTEDTATGLTILGTDSDLDSLTYVIVSNPSHGSLSGTGPNYTYTPNSNYTGSDSFTYKVNDGTIDSGTATMSVTVVPVNDAPVSTDGAITVIEDTPNSSSLSATDTEGSALTYSIVTQGSNGTVVITNAATGAYTYTPNANANGGDTFFFKANDGSVDSNLSMVVVTITPVNDTPITSDLNLITPMNTDGNAALSGTDVDGDTLTYSVVSQPSNGTVSISGGVATYSPNAGYYGSDSYTFKANDGTVDSNTSTVTITVINTNTAPVASNDSITTNEDSTYNGNLSATDSESNPLTYSVVSQGTKGTVVITNASTGAYTYTPNANANGSDSFTFKAYDGQYDSNTATISVTITPVNDAPIAMDGSGSVTEDTPSAVSVVASDIDSGSLTYTIVSGPTKGTLSGTGPNYTYTPNANATGADSFTFKANDGSLDSNTATFSLNISNTNDAPIATGPATITTAEDTAFNGNLTGTDADGDTISYWVMSNPTQGTLSLNNSTGAFTYTPSANYNGADSFSFKVFDGTVESSPIVVGVTVTPVNDAPVANSQSINVNQKTNSPITLTATDIEGSALTYTVVSGPSNGTLTGSGANLVYRSNQSFTGSDSFTFKVNDGSLDSNTATVSITVDPYNDAPVANNGSITTSEDNAVNGNLTGSDVNGDALTYSVVAQGSKGTVVITNTATGAYTYTPSSNLNGSDSFTFRVNDGTTNSNTATISVTIIPVNDAPLASPDSITVDRNSSQGILLMGYDMEGSALTYTIVSGPSKGVLSGTIPNLTYTPNFNEVGADSFTFKVNDGLLDSATETISITINNSNNNPSANNKLISTTEDTPVNNSVSATDLDGDSLTYSVVAQGTKGTVVFTNAATGAFTYTPNANANGTDQFTYRANDGYGNSNTATVTVNITPVNDAPVSVDGSLSVTEDVVKNGTLVATDVDGDSLTYSVVAQGTKGTVVITNTATGAYTYTPNANATGSDSFTFRTNDGTVNSNTATISVTINNTNDAPVANNNTLSVTEDTVKTGTLTATDSDGDALTYSVVAQGSKGTVVITNTATGAFTYTPNANATGADTFTFKANDGTVDSNVATISVTITNVNDAPVANNNTLAVTEDTVKTGTLTATDSDGDALTYSVVAQGSKGTVVITNTATGAFTYTPNANATGADTFTFRTNDGTVNSNTATISVTITNVNDAPVANNNTLAVTEDTAQGGTLTATDVDGDALTYSVVSQGTKGTVVITNTATGAYTYTPNANATGSDSFTFKVNDGTVDSNVATISVNISSSNDAPVANNSTLTVTEDVAQNGTLTATDIDGDALTYSVVAQGTKGTVVITNTATGAYTYTPNANATGSDSFTFRVNDGTVNSNTATISVTITPVNDAPVANNNTLAVTEDTAQAGTLTATDVDGDSLTYSVVAQGSKGTVVITNTATGAYTYTPNANATGSDSFTFRVNDGTVNSNTATISVTISTVNDAPVANNNSFTTNEDTSYNGTLTATDADGNSLTYIIVSQGAKGTVTITNTATGAYTYVPFGNSNGADSFTFRVNDGTVNSNTATISVTITPVNDAPISSNGSLAVTEDTAQAGTLVATDVDGDSLTYSVVAQGSKGTVVITNTATGAYTYTPNANATGSDSFTFRASDGVLNSNTSTISVTITNVNDAPVANNNSFTTNEDTSYNGTLTATDADGNSLTYAIVSQGTKGTVVITNASTGAYTYTPNANANGSDSFTFRVNDGTVNSNTATISVTITPVNDAPTWSTATTRTLNTNKNVAGNLTVTATDVDGDTVSYTIGTCTNGTCSVNASGLVTYTPTANYVGSATVTVNCSSTGPLSCSPVTTINVTVVNPNTAPVASATTAKVQIRTGTVAITLPATDAEGDTLTYSIVSTPTSGTLSGSGNSRTYTLGSWTACASEGGTCSFTGTRLVKYGSASKYTIQKFTTSTSCNNTVFSDPDPGAGKTCATLPLSDSFTFKANDGALDSNTATVTVNFEDWYNQSWTKRRKLVFNTPNTSEDLINFPVLVRLDSTRINYAQVKSQGQDLRFVDSGGNLLAHEIETWNTSGISYVWVKTSIGAAETNNHYIYMYYGNSGASDGQNKTAVWSNGYVAVYHMNQTTGSVLDSTNNSNGTVSGTLTRNTAGPLGNSYTNASASACFNSAHNSTQAIASTLTMETWAKVITGGTRKYFIQKDAMYSSSYYNAYAFGATTSGTKLFTKATDDNGDNTIGSEDTYITTAAPITVNKWHYHSAVYDGGFSNPSKSVKLFTDGQLIETASNYGGSLYGGTGWQYLNIMGDCSSDGFLGSMDEVRISNVLRSDMWVKTQYLSMTDSIIMYANEESSSSPEIRMSYVLNIKTDNDDGSNIIGGEGWRASGQNNTGTNWPGEENQQDSWAYLRFQAPVAIPSTGVTNARLKLLGRVYPGGGEYWNNASHYLRIYGQNSANAPQVTAGTQYPGSGITANANSVLWNSTLSLTWNWSDWNTSPDISPIISSIASSYSVNSGNYMQFWLKRGTNLSCGSGYWCQVGFVDYFGGSNLSGKLLIEW